MSKYEGLPAIAAIATPNGTGAIAIVRLSGNNSLSIASEVFRSKVPLNQAPPRQVVLGKIVDRNGKILDTALAVRFAEPASYTGEDMVEISCHGGPLLVSRVLELLLTAGARLAEPGEFTLRAFLNGKLDLTQAEAVMDLISAKTPLALQAAANQLEGELGRQVSSLRQQLLQTLAHLEAWIDFPDEGISPDDSEKLSNRLNKITATIQKLLDTSEEGRILREGAKIALCGPPNAGKSSLLNRLLGFDRAIVSELPGTTRDTIEEAASLHGIPCLFTDTAGLRETIDPIEKEGVIRARKAIEKADLIVEIYDASHSTSPPALEFPPNIPRILCANKCDLLATDEKFSLPSEAVAISCLTGEGIAKLVEKIVHNLKFTIPDSANIRIAINARHKACLERALVSLNSAIEGLRQNLEPEFVAVELHSALHSIGNIVGTPDAEEILGEIFSQFCIGK